MSYVLFFSLLFSIYYRIIFGTGKSGISVVLYVIPFLVCIIYLIKNNNKIKNKEAFIWCIPIALLSFTYLIFNNEFFLRWNVLFIPIFILVFIIKIQNKNITFNNLIREIFEAVFVPINHLGEVFQDVKKFYIGEKKSKEKEDKKQNNENLFSSNLNFEESSADSEIKNKSSYYDGTYYGKIGSVKYKVFNTEFLNNSEFNYYGRMLYQNHIYYMQIENYKTYCEYKKIFQDILEMSEDDFENQFMVIGFPEDINNLGIKVDNIFNSNGTLYINFTKFSDYEQNTYIINENGFSFVIPRSMERESFGIGVDMYNGYNNKSTNSLVAFNESHENENYTKEECIQIALDYAQTVANECVSSLAKDYYSKFTKVYEVNEFVSQRSNNYWDLIIANTPITDSNLNLGADESTYEIILVSPDDDLEVNRAYFYVNPYTGKVIAGREMSD